MTSKEYLRRIDKQEYLTEREHREYLEQLEKDLEMLEDLRKEIYKHWNIFYDAKSLESFLYLEQTGKTPFHIDLTIDQYKKIRKWLAYEKPSGKI